MNQGDAHHKAMNLIFGGGFPLTDDLSVAFVARCIRDLGSNWIAPFMDGDERLYRYVGASKCIGRRLLHGHLAPE